jgi:hypothetical protein
MAAMAAVPVQVVVPVALRQAMADRVALPTFTAAAAVVVSGVALQEALAPSLAVAAAVGTPRHR